MTHVYSPAYLLGLVSELRKLPKETEWVELKRNNDNPEEVGEYISALANSAALCGKAAGYLVWGVDDDTHDIVGTTVNPAQERKGNEELESWLLRLLAPRIAFSFFEVPTEQGRVVLLEVQRAARRPVQFQGQEFIRVGSYKKKLKEYPEKERELWRIFDATPFESGIALEHVTALQVLELLDHRSVFTLTAERRRHRRGASPRAAPRGVSGRRLEHHEPRRRPLRTASRRLPDTQAQGRPRHPLQG